MWSDRSDLGVLEALVTATRAGRPVALATVIGTSRSVPRHAGSKMLVHADGAQTGTIGGGEMESRVIAEALAALGDGEPRTLTYDLVDPSEGDPGVCGGHMELYVEPYLPSRHLVVVGCGHVGKAVIELAHWLGFRVSATDDRDEPWLAEAVAEADEFIAGPIDDLLAQVEITERSAIVVVSRNMGIDLAALPGLIGSEAGFIGVMGSQRRWQATKAKLVEMGVDAEALDRLHAPIGLELNAETPEEIAVSILAEVVMHQRDGTGEPMAEAGP